MAQEKKKSLYGTSTQKQKYSFFKPSPVSFPPQKRSSLPGSTSYSWIPPEPEPIVTELNEPLITENDNNILA